MRTNIYFPDYGPTSYTPHWGTGQKRCDHQLGRIRHLHPISLFIPPTSFEVVLKRVRRKSLRSHSVNLTAPAFEDDGYRGRRDRELSAFLRSANKKEDGVLGVLGWVEQSLV